MKKYKFLCNLNFIAKKLKRQISLTNKIELIKIRKTDNIEKLNYVELNLAIARTKSRSFANQKWDLVDESCQQNEKKAGILTILTCCTITTKISS